MFKMLKNVIFGDPVPTTFNMMFDEIHMKYTTSRCTNNIQHDVLMKYTYICKYHHFNVQNAQKCDWTAEIRPSKIAEKF